MTAGLSRHPGTSEQPIMRVDANPRTRRDWLRDQWQHRGVLSMLARSNFHVRYKRASFGVIWAVAVPAIQAASLAVVFSHFVGTHSGYSYPAFTVAAVLAWGYFSQTIAPASVAIVDASALTDKLWFPRSLVVFVPCLSNLPALLISELLFLCMLPVLGGSFGVHTLLLVPATVLLVAFCCSLSLVLSALHVYFRDVRYLVQAGLLVLFYLTPIAYPQKSVGTLGSWMDFNPLTGVANVFHAAAVGSPHLWCTNFTRSIAVTVIVTVVLSAAAIEAHRRHDRLFVDLL